MFRFEESAAFYLLLMIPLIVLVWYWSTKRQNRAVRSFSQPALFKRLVSNGQNERLKFLLFVVASVFVVIALVNPQYGTKKEKVKVENIDIFFALDISNSMNATDVSPSRLEKSKRFISKLINDRKGDQIGLILFAGGAYLQMPLTSDYAAADLFTKAAKTDMAGTQGTVISEAIEMAMRSVKEDNQRTLIIISDGEDHDPDAIKMADRAASKGWTIFTVGVGTDEGGFVPVVEQGVEQFKTDEEGNPVKSVINKELLQEIADQGKGKFYMLSDLEDELINDMNIQMEKLQKKATEVKSFSEYRSFYQYFLFIALMVLLYSFFYRSRKSEL